ncbi:S-adenosyl-L-methionine-dependent methyltransferase [Baffinella frigidus]|nr:S-adenosyl-L-methionine-dependent methyltransferase [Cryptophyta sp. CCMP2293]
MGRWEMPSSWEPFEASRRIAVPYKVLLAGAVATFFAGINVTMVVLIMFGWIGANSPGYDPGLRAISANPGVWCPDHTNQAGLVAKTLGEHEPGLGSYDRASSDHTNQAGLVAKTLGEHEPGLGSYDRASSDHTNQAGLVAKALREHEPGLVIDVGAYDGKEAIEMARAGLKHYPVIDVGAYDGKEAIEMARAGHKVLSFEPTPSKATRIREAIKDAGMQDKIDFQNIAISDYSGEAPFVVNVPVHNVDGKWTVLDGESKAATNMGSEQDGFTVPWKTDNSTTVQVRVEKLDNLVPAGQWVLFMKVDAQGHDFKVLKGAKQLLADHRILVFSTEISPGLMLLSDHGILVFATEISPGLMPGGAKEGEAMLNWIADLGYRCYGCGTSFETGFRFGLPVPFARWTSHLSTLEFEHRGANHGQWDDIVCVSKMAAQVELRGANHGQWDDIVCVSKMAAQWDDIVCVSKMAAQVFA